MRLRDVLVRHGTALGVDERYAGADYVLDLHVKLTTRSVLESGLDLLVDVQHSLDLQRALENSRRKNDELFGIPSPRDPNIHCNINNDSKAGIRILNSTISI